LSTDARAAGWRGQRGQATVETMLIAGLGVVFMAVAFQLYLVNRTVSRTLGEVHATMLSSMFQHNSDSHQYDRETVKVFWAPRFGVPSANQVPRLGLFRNDLATDLRVYSHWVEQHGDPDVQCDGASPPCKRTKAGGGLDAGSAWTVAGKSLASLTDGDYFGWFLYNGENAAIDITTLRDELQDVQEMVGMLQDVRACVDDVEACAWDCFWGDCPWN
jgi:hypothetical protein